MPLSPYGWRAFGDSLGATCYWPGIENSGTTLVDQMGGGFNLTLTNGPQLLSNRGMSRFREPSVFYDGSDDNATGSVNGGANTNRSFMMWVYPTEMKNCYFASAGASTSAYSWDINMFTNGVISATTRTTGGGNHISATSPIGWVRPFAWNLIGFSHVFNTSLTVFCNQWSATSTTVTNASTGASTTIWLGRRVDNVGGSFKGCALHALYWEASGISAISFSQGWRYGQQYIIPAQSHRMHL